MEQSWRTAAAVAATQTSLSVLTRRRSVPTASLLSAPSSTSEASRRMALRRAVGSGSSAAIEGGSSDDDDDVGASALESDLASRRERSDATRRCFSWSSSSAEPRERRRRHDPAGPSIRARRAESDIVADTCCRRPRRRGRWSGSSRRTRRGTWCPRTRRRHRQTWTTTRRGERALEYVDDGRDVSERTNVQSSFYINCATFFFLTLFYEFLKKRYPSIYNGRKYFKKSISSVKLPEGFFPLGWVPAVYKVEWNQVLEFGGLDAYCFLRYIRMLPTIDISFPIRSISQHYEHSVLQVGYVQQRSNKH